MEPIDPSVDHMGCRYNAKMEDLSLTTKSLISSPVSYDGNFAQHKRTISIRRNSSFQIQPHTITEGPMKGCQALVLIPMPAPRFLDLPTEVRDMIYELVLRDTTTELTIYRPRSAPSKVVGTKYAPHSKEWKANRRLNVELGKWIDDEKRTPLSLLQTNKQIYNEAFKVLYRSRAFSFNSEAALSRFFELNNACAQHITHIVLPPSAAVFSSMNLLAKARPRSLQELEIRHDLLFLMGISDLSNNIPATLLKLFTPLLDAVYLARQRKSITTGIEQLLKFDHGECIGGGGRRDCWGLENQLSKLIKEEYPMK